MNKHDTGFIFKEKDSQTSGGEIRCGWTIFTIYLSIYLSIYLFIYLSIYLSMCGVVPAFDQCV